MAVAAVFHIAPTTTEIPAIVKKQPGAVYIRTFLYPTDLPGRQQVN